MFQATTQSLKVHSFGAAYTPAAVDSWRYSHLLYVGCGICCPCEHCCCLEVVNSGIKICSCSRSVHIAYASLRPTGTQGTCSKCAAHGVTCAQQHLHKHLFGHAHSPRHLLACQPATELGSCTSLYLQGLYHVVQHAHTVDRWLIGEIGRWVIGLAMRIADAA